MREHSGWQQVADAASGCSFVTGRLLEYEDGTSALPTLPVSDVMTGMVGAIGALMVVRDHTLKGGSYHVKASLVTAAAYPLSPAVGSHALEPVT